MPQAGAIYSAARIRVLEKSLLNSDALSRILESDSEAIMRILSDWGYGGENSGSPDIEARIIGELLKCKKTVDELNVDKKVTDTFYLYYDMLNLKTLIKLKIQGKSLSDTDVELTPLGTIDKKVMQAMVNAWEFSLLPSEIAAALSELDSAIAEKAATSSEENNAFPPYLISLTVDKAYYRYCLSIKNAFIHEYFSAKCDFLNVLCLFRLSENAENSETILKQMLLPTGGISEKRLLEAYSLINSSAQKTVSILADGKNISDDLKRAIQNGVNSHIKTLGLEQQMQNYLVRIAKKGKWEMENILPVLGYILAKEFESYNLRLIVTMKRNLLPDSKIVERLCETYV